MKLNEPLETSFEFEGKTFEIDCSFDIVLDVFEMFGDDVLNDVEKLQLAIEIMTGEEIDDPGLASQIWKYIDEHFITVKKDPVIYDRQGNPMPVVEEDDKARLIDFEIDAQDIYASFIQAYGINLLDEQGKLTWAEFMALLNGLPDDTSMMKIVQIRSWKPSSHDSSEYKGLMRKLQRKYSLDREEE
jgi:hypothetical protein